MCRRPPEARPAQVWQEEEEGAHRHCRLPPETPREERVLRKCPVRLQTPTKPVEQCAGDQKEGIGDRTSLAC